MSFWNPLYISVGPSYGIYTEVKRHTCYWIFLSEMGNRKCLFLSQSHFHNLHTLGWLDGNYFPQGLKGLRRSFMSVGILKNILSLACLLFMNTWQCFVYLVLNCRLFAMNVVWQDMLLHRTVRSVYGFMIRKPPRKRPPERLSLIIQMDAVDQLASEGIHWCTFGALKNGEFIGWLMNY
jgi:hypothetical protein